ncbi:hypothetical protein [Roseovarius salis]|uniref:hypothetical protein n=1 Tax=Roseovarius salis TaxID=3376063 RepID=UPI0037C89C57
MSESQLYDRLDRHGLVMAVWSPAALLAAGLLHKGVTGGGAWWIGAGFGGIILGFVGHVIINTVLKTRFTSGETALGLVVFAAAIVTLLLTVLLAPAEITRSVVLPVGLGLVSLVVTVVVYLLIAFGPRGAFERFDVIRDNNLRPASRLPHRGGRR